MAKAISASAPLRLVVTTDVDGVPQSAYVDYRVEDGAAFKVARLQLESPDFSKILHNTGAAGEFWKDMVEAIKTAEGIS